MNVNESFMPDANRLIDRLIRLANEPARAMTEVRAEIIYESILAIPELRRLAGILLQAQPAMRSSGCGTLPTRDKEIPRQTIRRLSFVLPKWCELSGSSLIAVCLSG